MFNFDYYQKIIYLGGMIVILGHDNFHGTNYFEAETSAALSGFGVNMNYSDAMFRSSLALVAWKGQPQKVKIIQTMQALGPSRLTFDAMEGKYYNNI